MPRSTAPYEPIYVNYATADENRLSAIVEEAASMDGPVVLQQPTESVQFEGLSQRRLESFEQLRSRLERSDVSFSIVRRSQSESIDIFEADPEDWTTRHYAMLIVFSVSCLLALPLLLLLSVLNSRTGNPRFVEIQNSVLRAVPYSKLVLETEDMQADKERLRSAVEEARTRSGRKPIAIVEHDSGI